jgi:predicted  nucleic acid-binding Zn-ribbon protein
MPPVAWIALAFSPASSNPVSSMNTLAPTRLLSVLLLVTALSLPGVGLASGSEIALTSTGKKLEAAYAAQLEELKEEIVKNLPSLDPEKKALFLNARGAEEEAKAQLEAAQKRMGEINTAKALVGHAKGKWIGGADKGIAAAKEKLKKATTAAERKAAEEELAKWEQNREDGVAALKERQANMDKAEKDRPEVEKALKDAEQALADAKALPVKAVRNLELRPVLSSDRLDAKLAKYSVMLEATPRGLAAYAQQGDEQRELIDKMLAADDLLVQMAIADGAKDGQYGPAMEIYRAIWQASDKVVEGPLRRLALAISLEHAVPIKQRNAVARTDAPETVDPVQRYLHYEKALLAGELDPAFKDLTTWDFRMVVDGEEPDEILAWGREMLRNYRPDHVTMDDYRWRYVALVRSDIRYGSQDNKYDQDELQFFQNILKNGGICGRRAFIGRFILRAFGIPTTARPQRGHAALAHWTPDGWVVCLGGGWGAGWTKGRYNKDLDFLANTQARAAGEAFLQVKRAQWIGDVMGEKRVFGLLSGEPEFWYAASLYTQRGIIEDSEAKTLAAVGEDIGEANVTKEKIEITKVVMTAKDREVTVDEEGVITIPAAATSNPTKSTGKIIFMDSFLGGKQLHFSRNGGGQVFEYTVEVPAAGTYALTALVVTPSWKQNLLVTANGADTPVKMALPHTVGLWDKTPPVGIQLSKGKNTLRFSHQTDGYAKGFSIKEFTLTPVSGNLSLAE